MLLRWNIVIDAETLWPKSSLRSATSTAQPRPRAGHVQQQPHHGRGAQRLDAGVGIGGDDQGPGLVPADKLSTILSGQH